jgi:hypothetical protein
MGQLIEAGRGVLSEFCHLLNPSREANFSSFFNNLPLEDQFNVSELGKWALGIVESNGEVWVVGSTVRNFVEGKGTRGKDIDFRFLSNLPNLKMIERISKALESSFPKGFFQEREERWDDYFGIKYFTYKIFPKNSGRPIHILPPRIWEMNPEGQRRLGIFAEGPFCKIDGSVLDNFEIREDKRIQEFFLEKK